MQKTWTHTTLRLALCGLILTGIAACDSKGDDADDAGGIATLGATFQRAFSQGPNDAPIDISNAGLQVQLTQDPFQL